jgi:hypothetical protein
VRAPTPAKRPDALVDQAIDLAIMLGLAVLILVGFATSYRTLRDLATTEGGYPPWLAPAVPLSFDLGIIVLSLKVARAAREGRTAPVMRLLVALLSASTVVANASAASGMAARLLHAVPPAMFVICFESVVITARRRALAAMRLLPDPLPRVRVVRWLLAPRSTWTQWRTLVIAEAVHHEAPTVDRVAPRDRTALPATSPNERPATPSADGQRSRSARRQAASATAVPAAADGTRRAVVARTLAAHPDITAPVLVRVLQAEGFRVSVRTAQRLRSAAQMTGAEDIAGHRGRLAVVEVGN